MKVLIKLTHNGEYYVEPNKGTTSKRDEAHIYDCANDVDAAFVQSALRNDCKDLRLVLVEPFAATWEDC